MQVQPDIGLIKELNKRIAVTGKKSTCFCSNDSRLGTIVVTSLTRVVGKEHSSIIAIIRDVTLKAL